MEGQARAVDESAGRGACAIRLRNPPCAPYAPRPTAEAPATAANRSQGEVMAVCLQSKREGLCAAKGLCKG
jgi:hypothetical protein